MKGSFCEYCGGYKPLDITDTYVPYPKKFCDCPPTIFTYLTDPGPEIDLLYKNCKICGKPKNHGPMEERCNPLRDHSHFA